MIFNSIEFLLFLPLVFVLYWFFFKENLRIQNILIIIASYTFYGWWDWRFLSLIAISSAVDFMIGRRMSLGDDKVQKKLLLIISIMVNLGILGFFKYYNFFVDSFIDSFRVFSIELHPRTLNIILPVGISFYTFQTLSYTIDIYREKIKPSTDPAAFFAFVSFFPQLVAGPIERAANLLPQFEKVRSFDYELAKDGLKQILWGFFKKLMIADVCAGYVDHIFGHYEEVNASMLFLGAFYFAFQIYGDFSGYSDIAIGTAKLFGFKLMRNFATPYFSRDIAEFWRRWHISLSTWFKDYVFIPLGGSYGTKTQRIRNILVTFTVSGFWHGANWTFIGWGALNGLYYIPLMLLNRHKKERSEMVAEGKLIPSFVEMWQMLNTFMITLVAWVFFRSETIGDAIAYLSKMFSMGIFEYPSDPYRDSRPMFGLIWILLFILIEWVQREHAHGLKLVGVHVSFRWAIYTLTIVTILYNIDYHNPKDFIYFEF